MRILIAEVDQRSASTLRKALIRANHDVTIASDGADAWERYRSNPFPLVIAAWNLPTIDGTQLCRRIRDEFGTRYTYYILLSSHPDAQEPLAGLRSGADDHLTKPLKCGEMLAHVGIAERILNMQDTLHQLNARLEHKNQELGDTVYWLESANHRFSELFAGLPAACYSYDDQGRIFEWNRAAEEMFGYAPEEACHHLLWQLFSEDDPALQEANIRQHKATIQKVLAGESLLGTEIEMRRRDGATLHLLSNTIPVRAADDRITGIISANLDITERRNLEEQVNIHLHKMTELNTELASQKEELARANARLADISTTDGLTGLKNHRFLQETLQSCYTFARRHRLPMSLLIFDVDEFKSYNDTFGHPSGDDVLRNVASLLKGGARDHDTVARYGGEEFVVLLPATTEAEAAVVAERLRSVIQDFPWTTRSITVSVGVASYEIGVFRAPANHTDLLDAADRALYLSKQQGRNRITLASDLASGARCAMLQAA